MGFDKSIRTSRPEKPALLHSRGYRTYVVKRIASRYRLSAIPGIRASAGTGVAENSTPHLPPTLGLMFLATLRSQIYAREVLTTRFLTWNSLLGMFGNVVPLHCSVFLDFKLKVLAVPPAICVSLFVCVGGGACKFWFNFFCGT